jgi:hypothetical protein
MQGALKKRERIYSDERERIGFFACVALTVISPQFMAGAHTNKDTYVRVLIMRGMRAGRLIYWKKVLVYVCD